MKKGSAVLIIFGILLFVLLSAGVPSTLKGRKVSRLRKCYDGKFIVVPLDDFKGGSPDRYSYYLFGKKNRHYKLILKGKNLALRSQQIVRICGQKIGASKIRVSAITGTKVLAMPVAAAVVGVRRVAIARISSLDGECACSSAKLIEQMWTGAKSIKGLYEASSYGQTTLAMDSNGDGQPDLFEVNLPYNTLGMVYSNLAWSILTCQARNSTASLHN
jgi:hypothetical protein